MGTGAIQIINGMGSLGGNDKLAMQQLLGQAQIITPAQVANPSQQILQQTGTIFTSGPGLFWTVNAAGTGLNQLLDSSGSWAANLPTTLPGTAGALWNNGGVLSIS